MLTLALIVSSFLGADDFAPRLQVLHKHFDRLQAVVVPQELEAEKAGKLAEVGALLDGGATDAAQIDAIYLKMDAARNWLLAHATEKPQIAAGVYREDTAAWQLDNGVLKLGLNKADLVLSVTTPAAAWQFEPADNKDILFPGGRMSLLDARARTCEEFRSGYSVGMVLTLSDFPAAPGFSLALGIHLIGTEMCVSVVAPDDTFDFEAVRWPKPLATGATPADLAVIPCMQGMIVPGDWPESFERNEPTNSRALYMPWWGQIRDGNGVLTILETSDDAGAHYTHKPGEPTRLQPLWYSSLRRMRTQRWARYCFMDGTDYVQMAKRYRRYVQETGRFVSIEEKCARTPNVREIIGRPVVHLGALYHYVQQSNYFNKERIEANHELWTFDELAAQLRGLHDKGIEDAYVHLDGWGYYGYDNGHPDPLPPGAEQGGWDGLRRFADTCDELGWIFATHDQYRDFYFIAASFDRRLALERTDGGFDEHTTWCGGAQTYLSPLHAPEYVRRNHDLFAEHGIKVRGAYLDVFSIVPLEESFQRLHPVTRTECAEYRINSFDVLRARGYVVSSEEPVDRFVPHLDLVHHGPYFTFNDAGRIGIPVPLFSLVYHDSILLPWSMGETGGWGIPKGDAGWLHCLLNAGLPYVGTTPDDTELARVHRALELAGRCGTQEMLRHAFVDGNYRKQQTEFADHTVVTVDFDTMEASVTFPN